MKEQRSTVLWLFVVLAASCIVAWGGDLVVPYDPTAMHFNYTPEQAVEIARNWTGNPQVSVEFRGVYEDYPYVAPWYVLSTPDRVQGFDVDPHFGKVNGWRDDALRDAYFQKVNGGWDPASQRPPAELRAIEEQFLAAHYPGFNLTDFAQPFPKGDGPGHYHRKLPSGVWVLNSHCVAMLDEWTGDVYRFLATYSSPLAISVTPALTLEQAAAAALDWVAADPSVAVAFVVREDGLWVMEDNLHVQRLCWVVGVVSSDDPAYDYETYQTEMTTGACLASGHATSLSVDAHNGEIVGTLDGTLGGSGEPPTEGTRPQGLRRSYTRAGGTAARAKPVTEPKPTIRANGSQLVAPLYPPVVRDGTGYLYIRYLTRLAGGSAVWASGRAIVSLNGQEVVLRPGSPLVQVGQNTVRLSRPVINVNGRVYVAAEAVERISAWRASWNAPKRTLDISTRTRGR